MLLAPVRWIRINTVRADKSQIHQSLLHKYQAVDDIKDLVIGKIYIDSYIDNLYGLNPYEKITSLEVYKNGQIIIQDRASCFPAAILNPSANDILIDACSAPGNKTTHLATFVKNNNSIRITAFERDPQRARTLEKMITIAGCQNLIDIKVQDFTESDPLLFENVSGILVDPSCSGSGIFGRFDEQEKEKDQQDNLFRLHKLAEFQFKVVSHALNFPNVKTVVYSTCSIHPQENEHVVQRLLLHHKDKWKLKSRANVIPSWPRRGLVEEFTDSSFKDSQSLADSCIRAMPKIDGGIGFFAACFERI